jgi:hypothetical protein
MKKHHCVTQQGEHFIIQQNDEGKYLCPICGSAEFIEPPYYENGSASFQMCSCGFEFGFDDSSLASKEALNGIVLNWDRWRLKVIAKYKHTNSGLEMLERNLKQIGYELAFDLIPVKKNGNT